MRPDDSAALDATLETIRRDLVDSYDEELELGLEEGRLDCRVCRVAAPSERERTQRYFQRSVSHLLARIPCGSAGHPSVHLPERLRHADYVRGPVPAAMVVPAARES